ncbi:DUF1707 domain-containing protein, partial [Streptomyces sp. TRM76130]|nr:DUF1707 domain-containing protein [Streptomyces sp. TRM76130]
MSQSSWQPGQGEGVPSGGGPLPDRHGRASRPSYPHPWPVPEARAPQPPPWHGQGQGQPSVLASHAERERAVDVLRAGYAEGRLEHAEFEKRVAGAYGARTVGELATLVADLPQGPAPVGRAVVP